MGEEVFNRSLIESCCQERDFASIRVGTIQSGHAYGCRGSFCLCHGSLWLDLW